MTATQGLVEVQQGPLGESVHFRPQEGSDSDVIKPTFNTQSFLKPFLAWAWLVIKMLHFAG